MKKTAKKIMMYITVFVLLLGSAAPVYTHAASKTGTYLKVYKVKKDSRYPILVHPSYGVVINRIKKGKIRFQISKCGLNGSPLYDTYIINARLKNNKAVFTWEDSWSNQGNGVLKLGKGYVKLKMNQTVMAKWNRSTLDTAGKFIKMKKKNNKKKIYEF